MTMNLLWSDDESSYVIVDSARSHQGDPKFSHSVLGQAQRLPEMIRSVEEGAQKLIPLSPCFVAALCGNEFDVVEFTKSMKAGLTSGSIYDATTYLMNLSGPERISVSIGIPGMDPPFTVIDFPGRQLLEVQRRHIHISGSLPSELKEFLFEPIQRFLIDHGCDLSPECRLASGLAIATTMALHHNLPRWGVGGAFFGARMDKERFIWQPDIAYMLYAPNFANGLPFLQNPDEAVSFEGIENASSRLDIISCLVRDNVRVALSSIGMRSAIAWSEISIVDGIDIWSNKWSNKLFGKRVTDPEIMSNTKYFTFIPKTPGVIAIVPNNGNYVRIKEDQIALSDVLVNNLMTQPSNGAFALSCAP